MKMDDDRIRAVFADYPMHGSDVVDWLKDMHIRILLLEDKADEARELTALRETAKANPRP